MATFNATDYAGPAVILDWSWQTTCKLIFAITGICGNSLVIAVYNGKRKRKNTTNVLILALACADLVSSIMFIPLPIVQRVPQNFWGEIYCRFVFSRAFLWISIAASVYTLTLLSVERYMAVVHPIRYRSVFAKSRRPRWFVVIIWVFAVTVKSFNFYSTTIVKGAGCSVVNFPKGLNLLIAADVAIVEYLIPIAVMVICNGFTIRALRSQARNLQSHNSNASSAGDRGPAYSVLQTRRRVIHIVLIVIITFIICWTPDQISILLVNLEILPIEHVKGNMHQAFVILAFFNSCANPIIYTFKNKNFRISVARLFRCRSARVNDVSTVTDLGHTAVAGGSDHVNAISKRTTATTVTLTNNDVPEMDGIQSVHSVEDFS